MAKKELKDFKGQPYLGQIYWEDLDKDFLIRIMQVWHKQIVQLGYGGYHVEITKRYGAEVAREITEAASVEFAKVCLPLLMEAARIKPTKLAEAMNLVQISADSGTPSRKAESGASERTIDCDMRMVDEKHFQSVVNSCTFANQLFAGTEGMPADQVDAILQDMCTNMDMRIFKLYIEIALGGNKKVETWLDKSPSVKTKNEKPHCIMNARVVD